MKNDELMNAYLSIIYEASDKVSPWAGRSLKTMISLKNVTNNQYKRPELADNKELTTIVNNFQKVTNVKELIDNLNSYLNILDDLLPSVEEDKKRKKNEERENPPAGDQPKPVPETGQPATATVAPEAQQTNEQK